MAAEYFQISGPTNHAFKYLDPESPFRCDECGIYLDYTMDDIRNPNALIGKLFLSDDLRLIASQELNDLWISQANIVPIAFSKYAQIVPTIQLSVASSKCREESLCSSGNHFSIRLCDDEYLRPPVDIAIATAELPRGSFAELYLPFFVRSDIDKHLADRIPGYRSRKVRFAND